MGQSWGNSSLRIGFGAALGRVLDALVVNNFRRAVLALLFDRWTFTVLSGSERSSLRDSRASFPNADSFVRSTNLVIHPRG